MPRFTYDTVKNLDPAEISKLSKSQMIDLLRKVRSLYQRREKQLERVKDSVFSPALDKMKDYYDENKQQALSRISRAKAYNEIMRIQEFFRARTSDVKGAREVQREQDIRVYGEGATGKPLHRLTIDQRTKFWEFYNEYIKTYKNEEFIYGSNQLQQYIGDIYIASKKKLDVNADVFANIKKKLKESVYLEDEEDLSGDGEVYSGKGYLD